MCPVRGTGISNWFYSWVVWLLMYRVNVILLPFSLYYNYILYTNVLHFDVLFNFPHAFIMHL